ncbi:MAG: hemerythrin cation binding protein [Rhodospirillales bacterium]|jgi:hemerythrin-like domain-containing protein|nr:hemerythrin cation binding protein [Rhodospirillales bacterium]
MAILELLKADHAKVKSLLEETLGTEDATQRSQLIKQIKTDLTAHSHAEEKVLYRRMEKSEEGKDEALEGDVEHELVLLLCDQLARSRSKGSDPWTARCSVLKELIEHHVEEEEGEFFKTARRLFDRPTLQRMGNEFIKEKSRLGVAPAAEAAE